ncbi:DUF1064 domain-containing protein [Lactococcus piscium]|uniref:Prophage protein n=1 Tax=Pseudolactococcus piscium MKFS47 TaxID=297352 RepID=A0A0D6DZG7_9LACT|nr:DUF1064 domain-containing protein [Lactococcus piscium]CEN29357.1 Prophage protein [Lactococcus piscium MKFS47]
MVHKYRAVKTKVDDIVFDSKAEALYYQLHKHDKGMKMQEKFVLMDKFRLNGKAYREIAYVPDFTFYDDDDNLIKIVDVKGMLTSGFKIKAKMFANRYNMQITVAKKMVTGNKIRFDETII